MASVLYAQTTVQSMVSFLLASPPSSLSYPTSFTQGIEPKGIHSHNDYERAVPLLTGLSVGVTSTEADLWLINGTLYVGHTKSSLTADRTFAALYIDPLVEILSMQNPTTPLSDNITNGIYDVDSTVGMQLLLDYKSNGPTLHPWVIAALEPLRSRGWLTTYSSVTNTTTWGPITVVGSGQAIYAASLVVAQEPRDIFLDAPLANLTGFPYGRDVAPLASTSFKQATGYTGRYEMTNGTKAIINNQIAEARARGMKVRYWDTTNWPVFCRNRIWTALLEAGVDYLNADDVAAAAAF